MQYELDHLSDEFHELEARTKCLNAYSDITRSGAASDLQLSYFAQNHPREGITYKREIGDQRGIILQTYVNYIPIFKKATLKTEGIGTL